MDMADVHAQLLGMGFSVEQCDRIAGQVLSLEDAIELITCEQSAVAPPGVAQQPQVARQSETRMVIVVRTDLKMSTGKTASQVAHAAVALFARMQRRHPEVLAAWEACNTPKICLRVDSLRDLEAVEDAAAAAGLPSRSICDAGRTQVRSSSKRERRGND